MRLTLTLLFCLFRTASLLAQLKVVSLFAPSSTNFSLQQFNYNSQQIFDAHVFTKEAHILKQRFKLLSQTKKQVPSEIFGYPPPLFYLQSATNSKKTLQLKRAKIILFVDESTPSPQTQISKFNTTECLLDSMNGDSVVVTLLSEEIDIDYRNKYTNITNTYFGGSYNKVQKSVALKNIVYLQTRNPLRTGLSKAGTVLMGAAIVLIVGSPFAGLRQEGDARIAARERVFSVGLGCFATSVPLFIFGKPKKYHISPNYKTRKNAYWKLLQH